MMNLCVIPARGGSKRFKNKNRKIFFGKPIISYTIESAIKSKCFNKILVSSDDYKILKIAKNYNVSFETRKNELSTDTASVSDVLIDIIKRMVPKPDIITCLFPTAPLRNHNDIKKVVNNVSKLNYNFSLAVTKFSLPPHQALKIDKKNVAKPMWPSLVNKKESQLPDLVVDNGSTYSAKVSEFLKTGHFFGSSLKVHLMNIKYSIDLNTKEDFNLLQYYYNRSFK